MPEINRAPTRMTCEAGLDLVHPVDRMPPGAYPYLTNARVVEEGRLDARPGYTQYDSSPAHSMRRLNDPDDSFAGTGYTNVVGEGPNLKVGPQGALALVDTGYSTNPLSLLTFRPDQSPETWMYVYDQNKQAKVRPDGLVQPIGVPPPGTGPVAYATYGPPAMVTGSDGQVAGDWGNSGTAGSPTLGDRASQMSATTGLSILKILYDQGSTGWCCLVPTTGGGVTDLVPSAMGNRMKAILSTGPETVLVREVHPAIGSTTIAGIAYDSGTTGKCTIVLAAQPASSPTFDVPFSGSQIGVQNLVSSAGTFDALSRNSVVQLGGSEYVRVLSVTLSPDGSTYSFECVTTGTRAIGDAVAGFLSWYCYTLNTHSAGESITAKYVYAAVGAGASQAILFSNVTLDMAVAASRPIDPANDYVHCSFYCDTPTNLGYLDLRIYMGQTTSDDYYSWTVTPDVLVAGWNELTLPIAQAIRNGQHTGENLTNVRQFQVIANVNNALTFGLDWLYLFGTYGPVVQPNSPVGLSYCSTNRNSGTGAAASVPGPPLRYQLFPLREQVLVTPQNNGLVYNGIAYVDKLDIYRMGGAITNFTYVGTVPNSATPNTYADNLPDSSIAASPQADFTLLQPWPLLTLPWSGTVNVSGTRVTWVSGSKFDLNLLSASVILINGVAFQTYGQPRSTTSLDLFQNAGVQTGVSFQVASPTLAAQPLAFAFGPLEGPLVPVAFGLGDPVNGGTLYYSNAANFDAASDLNTLELAPPGEPLVSGATWNGLVLVGSRENLYLSRYSYLQTLGIPGQTTFQFQKLPSPSGMWSRWAVAAGADGVYFLGRDGIYRATGEGAVSITDHRLYPIFPHDGSPGKTTYGALPPDMSNLPRLRLSAADEDVYFDYSTASGAS